MSTSHAFWPEQLFKTQAVAVRALLKRALEIANAARYDAAPVFSRPHQTFVVDGRPGSGKNYALSTLAHVIQQLSPHWPNDLERISGSASRWWEWLSETTYLEPPSSRVFKQLAHVLFMSSSPPECASIEERVFSSMKNYLEHDACIWRSGDAAVPVSEYIKGIGTDFANREIARSDKSGLLKSRTYNEFIAQFQRESRSHTAALGRWMRFVTHFLDGLETAVLVVLLEEPGTHPGRQSDSLYSTRMFLNHPRIMTVISSNLRLMRAQLMREVMRNSGASFNNCQVRLTGRPIDDQHDDDDKRRDRIRRIMKDPIDWRRIQRREIEDYLEVVLPPSQRYFIR